MKIGILTFHYANNYGAVLQTYALQEYLKNEGYNVEIINYRSKMIEDHHRAFPVKRFLRFNIRGKVKILLTSIVFFLPKRKKRYLFRNFRNKYLSISEKEYMDINSFNNEYDIYIIGSDQVWSFSLTFGIDDIYWGNFLSNRNVRKITYAASSGPIKEFEGKEFFLEKALINFDFISVREKPLQKFLEQFTTNKISVVLDPTLLVDKNIFDRIAVKPPIDYPYILVYSVSSNEKFYDKVANALSKKYNEKIVIIGFRNIKNMILYPNYNYYPASIEEYLGLFKYANRVITLSFHGTVFSLLFEKEFYSVSGQRMDRIKTLLEKVGLERRISPNANDLDHVPIDYKEVNRKLEREKIDSKEYLKLSLDF